MTTRTLSEHESKALLAALDVPLAPETLAPDAATAGEAAAAYGVPVAVKLCGTAIAHKTERGLVRLGLSGAAAVSEAAAELLAAGTEADGVTGVLVAPMVRGSRELIAGYLIDDQFGPVVMLGVGGIVAEAVADVAFRLAPVSRAEAFDLLDDLATQSLLGEFRGEAAVDVSMLVDLLVGLGRLPTERPDVTAVDLNPLIVGVDGTPVAVDALVEVRS